MSPGITMKIHSELRGYSNSTPCKNSFAGPDPDMGKNTTIVSSTNDFNN